MSHIRVFLNAPGELLEIVYTNPLRVLDSKNPDVQALLNDAPTLGDYLDEGEQRLSCHAALRKPVPGYVSSD